MKNQNKTTAAFFDLDLTLTQKDSFRCFLAWFYKAYFERNLALRGKIDGVTQ